jgi:crotonobetainyl-CoA:carnitine CoA-transferase CaiB-like acyl-CoA transferase
MNDADIFRGIRVADFSQGIAGPYCGMLLAQYGADVVKIEPPGGDWLRGLGKRFGDQTALALVAGRGKRSLALDIRQAAGRDVAKRLIAGADVVIENNRPGVMARLGLDYATVKRPELIYLAVTGFGQESPHKERPATDMIIQAFTGLTRANAGNDGIPHRVGVLVPDTVTALYGFQAVSMALYARAMGRGGRYLDVSLTQSMAAFQANKLVEAVLEPGAPELLAIPGGTFRTVDGWISIAVVTEEQWQRLCPALGRPELANDPRYATFAGRRGSKDSLMAAMHEVFATRTSDDWIACLGQADVLANRVNSYVDFLGDPHVAATHTVTWVEQPAVGRIPIAGMPGAARPNQGAPAIAPAIGEHSRAVLAELGLGTAEIDTLFAEGVAVEPKASVTA